MCLCLVIEVEGAGVPEGAASDGGRDAGGQRLRAAAAAGGLSAGAAGAASTGESSAAGGDGLGAVEKVPIDVRQGDALTPVSSTGQALTLSQRERGFFSDAR